MGRVGIWIFVAAAFVAAAAEAFVYALPAGEVMHVATYSVLCALAWWSALRLRRGRDRLPWLLIAACQTLWFAGDAYELLELHLTGAASAVGPADAFWLGGYPLLAVALAMMARRRAAGGLRASVVDALILTVAAAAVSWQFIMRPLTDGYTLAESTVPLLYPLADVVLLTAALVIALSPGTRTAPTRLLLAGVLCYLFIDLAWNVLPYLVSAELYDPLGAVVLAGNALITAAGLHPGRAELATPGPDVSIQHPARIFFLALALLTAPVLSVFIPQDLVGAITSATCALLVVARFVSMARAQERAQAQLAYQASCDPLTGLANRTALGARLARIEPAPDAPVAVLYVDLDGFKQVNDEHGHAAGDAVLRIVSDRLSAAVREGDLVARLGGDEFVLLCPGVPTDEAVRLAERIIGDVARPVAYEGHHLCVGASIGIAGSTDDATEGLLRSADAAMYEAKRLGRGRWVLSS
ncbi:GGDEF domain-containing protein [Actinoplanes sp. NPDC049118]|uniref:GGDEF domain-containing protein n=1 Tax=Actinoplanes sp. NPDC049118 TaxID=3155769 RepID=UPI00341141AC